MNEKRCRNCVRMEMLDLESTEFFFFAFSLFLMITMLLIQVALVIESNLLLIFTCIIQASVSLLLLWMVKLIRKRKSEVVSEYINFPNNE